MHLKNILFLVLLTLPLLIHSQSHENWFVNKNDAIKYATANNNNILMVFAGSDWCGPCIKLKKEVLDNDAFKEISKGQICILYLDFPARKKNKLSDELTAQNEALAEIYNRSGSFPKLVLMDKNLQKIKDIDYQGQDAASFPNLLNE